jgi:glycosyltransferase involved in cell wall biosynthesis
MRHAVFVVPDAADMRSGGSIYDRRIADGLRAHGWCVDVVGRDLGAVPDGALTIVDGLALLGMRDAIEPHARRLRLVSLIHLPLALEVGLDSAEAERRDRLERRAVDASRLVVATGRLTVERLAARGVESTRIALVEPGTDRAPIAAGSGGSSVALLSVAAVTAGKGHESLLRALAASSSRRWSLVCAGSVDRDPATAARVRRSIPELGLENHVVLAGELKDAELEEAYRRSDAFVLATRRETYGMAVAEAIAHGLPVVSTTVGAIPSIAGAGGLLVPPDDDSALAHAIERVVSDDTLRKRLARGAREARQSLRTWSEASRELADVMTRLDGDG